ncbi:hypothetical protein Taro_003265 [Colocasia esculenta]|uniref:Uncharacterized protein n=1 Tax=Colocasia esculenta TaxID=4460 RepID=A0A843TL33_COLES|nr:hypothetical protein [Colocasia esculenta]
MSFTKKPSRDYQFPTGSNKQNRYKILKEMRKRKLNYTAIGLNMSGPKTWVTTTLGQTPKLQTQIEGNCLDNDTSHGEQLPLVH